MRPVRHAGSNVVYRGPGAEIGDLWCQRIRPHEIRVVYELSDQDRELIAAGGRVELAMYCEPIPPISMAVLPAGLCEPVGPHGWKGQREDDPTGFPPPGPPAPYLRCTRCALELTEAQSEGLRRCPRCHTTGLPMLVADDVTIAVNWHELRILGMWAENWAAAHRDKDDGDSQRLVNIICGRIHAQHPDRAPLTMTGELGDLKRWADKNAGGMEIGGFTPDTEAEPGFES